MQTSSFVGRGVFPIVLTQSILFAGKLLVLVSSPFMWIAGWIVMLAAVAAYLVRVEFAAKVLEEISRALNGVAVVTMKTVVSEIRRLLHC
ncbi:hypothetical protein HOI83_03995 [Candidatus Uhrbacteria bacterium]|jgi:hypothetical protein|nr:hypothetical protein [Candidatus Uhrbacteria bacterium]